MSCHEPTLIRLQAAGYRLTPQRTMIAEALHHLDGHVTAEEVLARVQRQHPYMDLSTVYRTLELLTRLDLVRSFTSGGGPTRYELAAEPHHHLVCLHCGLERPVGAEALQSLVRHLADRHAFEATFDHLAIPGRCADCRRDA